MWLGNQYSQGRTDFPILRMRTISWDPVEGSEPVKIRRPPGPSIFGGFALAPGHNECCTDGDSVENRFFEAKRKEYFETNNYQTAETSSR
jgi:hypothetical protein